MLLHGWGSNAGGLRSLQQALAVSFDVIVPDLPGFGDTQAPARPWGLDEYAGFVADFLKKIDATNIYAIVGHSNGGAIAVRGIARGILEPERLILLASAGIRGEYRGRQRALRYLVKGGKLLTAPLPRAVRQHLRRGVYKTVGSDMLVAERLQETFKRVVADDVRGDAAKISLPTLLLYGDNDTATPVHHGKMLQEAIKGSMLNVIPGAGHFIYIDRPAETIEAIQEFLS